MVEPQALSRYLDLFWRSIDDVSEVPILWTVRNLFVNNPSILRCIEMFDQCLTIR